MDKLVGFAGKLVLVSNNPPGSFPYVLSVRNRDEFPRWNLLVGEEGQTKIYAEFQEGVVGRQMFETPPIPPLILQSPEVSNG